MLSILLRHVDKAKFLVTDNSTTILTAVSVVGTVSTAVLTGRATFKAAQLIEQEERAIEKLVGEENGDVLIPVELTLVGKIKLIWREYIPPTGVMVTTITCIIVANKIASKKIAALALAGGISERALQEYKSKVVEKLGERQDTKIRDQIAQERVSDHPVNSRELILAGTGEVLCYDMLTGRYFQSTMEEIKRAENKINHELNNHMNASLSEFYDEIGLPATPYTDSVGWNANNIVKLQFSAVMSTDDRPCLAIYFEHPPITDYHRFDH
jgi:hypothetical protein